MKQVKILGLAVIILLIIILVPHLLHKNTDQDFWNWFSANQVAIASITTAEEPIADGVSSMLSKVDPNLVWTIGGSPTDMLREFIISADGIQSSFPSVTRLVNAAPKNLTNWKITAFRPITDTETLTYAGQTLSVDSLHFSSKKNGDKYDIYVYVKNYQEADKPIVYLFLDSWLGEYNTETKLAGIEIVPYNEKNTSATLPFREIAKNIQ